MALPDHPPQVGLATTRKILAIDAGGCRRLNNCSRLFGDWGGSRVGVADPPGMNLIRRHCELPSGTGAGRSEG
jgi:hypothetical protein